MFSYATLGTSDLARSIRFYNALMAILGEPRCWSGETGAAWGSFDDPAHGALVVGAPFDGREASVGNGAMLALRASCEAMVRQLHAAALAHGGSDEGAPGPRPQYGPAFFGGYARDPDGNKLAFVFMRPIAADTNQGQDRFLP